MADNVAVTPGTGATIATDDVGGVQFQRVKIDAGGDGVSSPFTDFATNTTLSSILSALGGTLTVDSKNLDIRDLTSASDSIAAVQSGSWTVSVTGTVTVGTHAVTQSGAWVLGANSGIDIGDVDVTSVDPGTGATSLGKAEDSPHTTGDVGVMALGVRQDTAASLAGNGDYVPIPISGSGHVWTTGQVAHDSPVVGHPMRIGGKANSAAPAAVSANNDQVDAWFLLNGAQATAITAAGALIGGDATNGLDVDVTRLPGLGANTSTTAATFAQGVKTVAAAATPERLVGSTTLVETVTIQAKKGFNSANTSAVFIGFTSANDANYLELLPGDSVRFEAPSGKKLDLRLIYIEVITNGDGVTYTSVN